MEKKQVGDARVEALVVRAARSRRTHDERRRVRQGEVAEEVRCLGCADQVGEAELHGFVRVVVGEHVGLDLKEDRRVLLVELLWRWWTCVGGRIRESQYGRFLDLESHADEGKIVAGTETKDSLANALLPSRPCSSPAKNASVTFSSNPFRPDFPSARAIPSSWTVPDPSSSAPGARVEPNVPRES